MLETHAAREAGETPDVLVEVRDLGNRFGTQWVHRHLDLELYAGEILGVVGGSGMGKSVLMRTILGLRRPDAGSVRLFGEDPRRVPASQRAALERRCGVLSQNSALFSSLTVSENVRLPLLEHTRLSRRDACRVAALKIALAGLDADVRDKLPSELSGGMRKRAGLARALALDPDIVFLDEPTSGLDPVAADSFDRLIRTLHDALGLTVFMITHDLDSLHAVTDRVAVLARGRIIVADKLSTVERFDDPWIHQYFDGARGRAARAIPGFA
jgi:phospholipid/cholesterol/gamma-HCH transport system ATP-binding protein